ncbi:hypothetical protein N7493_000870 [Penicillium malachiteum]|uniref:Amidase domain-containing protein n=1 Tax=Penicillium malachiteum TaxID=1324776 RepID=A0AAD6N168_9EURO|nr:hypothetical protein N7493_000870 [Penicillium malachiteum]
MTVDAAPIITLRAAGALFLGKTTTTEFAVSYDGSRSDTKNPHNLECTPGGSSSGSGAAVGDYQVPIALGTQTVGSTIRPGSFNGVYAFKPTWGAISQEGLSQYSVSNDTVGFFSRSVKDLRLLTTAFQFTTDLSLPIGPFSLEKARLAFCKTPGWSLVGSGTRSAWEAGQALLSRAGATVSDLQLPAEFAKVKEWHLTILASEARAAFLGNYLLAKEKMDPSLVALVEQIPDRKRQLAAYDGIARLRPLWDTISEKYHAIVVPSAVDEAPKGLGNTGDPFVCAMWTMLGVPVINIPGFAGENGLPIGLSLVSSRYNDLYLLQVAEAVGSLWETAGNFRSRLLEST